MDLNTKRIQKVMKAYVTAKNPKFKALWSNKALALMDGKREPQSRVVQQSEYN